MKVQDRKSSFIDSTVNWPHHHDHLIHNSHLCNKQHLQWVPAGTLLHARNILLKTCDLARPRKWPGCKRTHARITSFKCSLEISTYDEHIKVRFSMNVVRLQLQPFCAAITWLPFGIHVLQNHTFISADERCHHNNTNRGSKQLLVFFTIYGWGKQHN